MWIEITSTAVYGKKSVSLPVRECGLKFAHLFSADFVIPSLPVRECGLKLLSEREKQPLLPSLPVRECGLKYLRITVRNPHHGVTPCAGVWIEIPIVLMYQRRGFGHSLCGSVD